MGGFENSCARQGPENTCNCNPGCNPGGAFCCVALSGGSFVAMSFDLFFQPCRFAGPDGVVGSRSEPLTDAEEKAVRSVLARVCPAGPDAHQCWSVKVGDGGGAEVFASDLGHGCMIALRGMTPGVVQWMFSVLVAGNWVLIPVQKKVRAITASMDAIRGIPRGFPDVVVCESSDGLGALLAGGIEEWAKYRDRVIGR